MKSRLPVLLGTALCVMVVGALQPAPVADAAPKKAASKASKLSKEEQAFVDDMTNLEKGLDKLLAKAQANGLFSSEDGKALLNYHAKLSDWMIALPSDKPEHLRTYYRLVYRAGQLLTLREQKDDARELFEVLSSLDASDPAGALYRKRAERYIATLAPAATPAK